MSTVEYTATSTLAKIKLGRRISELMTEKGEAYSIRAFAEKVGMNRETFRHMLLGTRRIAPSELELISKGLNVSQGRLKQEDTFQKEQELVKFLTGKKRTKMMLIRAQELAIELAEVALGLTEKGYSLNNLGRVQFVQEKYEEAHKTWLATYEYAKRIEKEFEDKQLLHLVTSNLMLTFTIRKEYSNIEEMLNLVEDVFSDDPSKLSMAYYTRMIMNEDRGELEQAKKLAYRSLELFEQTNDNKQIGRALINVAHYEYVLGNYKTSARLLGSAINIVKSFEEILIIALKEYVKSLLQLRDYHLALQIIDEYDSLAQDYPEYWGRLQIMRTVAKDDPSCAESVLNNTNLSVNLRYLACKSLMEFYYLKDDGDNAIRYYERAVFFQVQRVNF
ncbi:Hermansky-Pudlak syndrome 3 (HPS3) protein [Tumebacillus sp. BK434]|uniref:helix-turn-helix domain-containing protein n=1 Tax=Tumebacillus sp. BK434 TaxID=2512169 RepID=UPI00104F1073|nr:helix-turn-helix transcriptional regulator [Tumebacillus sp. BK434]TCP59376.1 Hermansky-Pudlak syndrome 3 (HPS3) protein [Tumebacillus sp. BK434]